MVDVPRPGRRPTSILSPREQNAAAQTARRDRMIGAGYLWRGFWLDKTALAARACLKTTLRCSDLRLKARRPAFSVFFSQQ